MEKLKNVCMERENGDGELNPHQQNESLNSQPTETSKKKFITSGIFPANAALHQSPLTKSPNKIGRNVFLSPLSFEPETSGFSTISLTTNSILRSLIKNEETVSVPL
ncbi:hypothetical protein H5410_042851 [Solanum commersonii]|uniref:Uncharacterized protein n=1 Tax=Solanum commersonii TaxID=4109 RepID=A0A9J5XVW1_SOLCO|nr:hypothetical protein H5410_042851 [Solanum commersonii]